MNIVTLIRDNRMESIMAVIILLSLVLSFGKAFEKDESSQIKELEYSSRGDD